MGTRLLGIVQARMGSTRLPGKVLLPLGDETVLARVIHAARAAERLDDVVVATTIEPDDDAVVAECQRLGVACYRGPVDDVLGRFLGALAERPANAVVRFTADCPLLDPAIVALTADTYRTGDGLDYVSTALVRTLPRGMDVEIVRATTLRSISTLASSHDRTHVTSYIYSHPDDFALLGLDFAPSRADLRLTLDTPEDLRLIERVVDHFGTSTPSLRELAAWLDSRPDVRALNADVRQKPLAEG